MKAMVILFIVALAISCITASGPYANGPAYPSKCGVANVEPVPQESGMQRGDSMIPDMLVQDGFKPIHFMTRVGDSPNDQMSEFPWPQMQ